jgi:hypothetical protein
MSAFGGKADIAQTTRNTTEKKKLRAEPYSVSAAVERSAWFVAVLLLRHGGTVANEFSKNRDRLFAGIVEPINPYAVIGVGVFRDLEHIGRSAVVKFHGQCIRREDVVGDVTAPLSGDVFICHCIGAVCRTDRKQNCNRYKPRVFHGTTLALLENPQALYVKRNDGEADFDPRRRRHRAGQTINGSGLKLTAPIAI